MPEGTGELYHEFEARTTDIPFGNTITMAYEAVNLFVLGIQRADSFDPDAVKAALDDPDLRFDWFGFSGKKRKPDGDRVSGPDNGGSPVARIPLAGHGELDGRSRERAR